MFTAIRAETAHSPTYQLLRGGRSPGSGNQVIAGKAVDHARLLVRLSGHREMR
jgi:hypothetical protein